MFGRILFLLLFIPFIEFYFLVQIYDQVGFANTLFLVLITGFVGAALLRQQGHTILMEMQANSAQGQLPSDAIAKGFFTFIGGVLLLTPGILTDVIGLSLIFPGTQFFWKKYFTAQWKQGVSQGNIKFYTNFGGSQQGGPAENPFESLRQQQRRFDPEVIDVDAQAETIDKKTDT